MKKLIVIALLYYLNMPFALAQPANKIQVAAASDLKFALDSIVTIFRKNNQGTIEVTYGSSGKLCEQILHGAPFDVFFSADISYPEKLKAGGKTISEIYPYGIGRIVIWSKHINPQEGMKALLSPSVKKIAIANPLHAPYGKRAEEAIAYYKMNATVKDKLVLGENISQTAQFITTGAADIGIIALSLALSPNMQKQNGKYFLIPETTHKPLIQGMVLTQHAKNNKLADAFANFIKGKIATAIFAHFGFTRP